MHVVHLLCVPCMPGVVTGANHGLVYDSEVKLKAPGPKVSKCETKASTCTVEKLFRKKIAASSVIIRM